jgi:F0F1-type ATP synthase membrane subunit b/b'
MNNRLTFSQYTYFTLAAINVKVPKSIKRGLTTLQIAQFVFGASFAAIHLFVQYDIPIATPYKVLATVSSVAASATSAVASATSTVSEVIETPTAAVAAFNWPTALKWILRAAGEEGLAERIGMHDNTIHDHMPLAQQAHQIEERMEQAPQHVLPVGPKYETRWRNTYTKVNCIDTSGEAFAIYLNIFYLFPLTVLFARFFYKAYVRRGTRPQGVAQNARAIGQDARQAEEETERAIEAAGKRAEDQMRNSGAKAQQKTRDLLKEFHEDVQKVKESGKVEGRKMNQVIEDFEQKQNQHAADSNGDSTSTPKKSPKKKNNNKKNKQGGGDDSRPNTSQENKQGGGDGDDSPSTSQDNKKGGDSRPGSSQKNNEADVHDELKTKVDLKPEGQDAKSNGESSEASKPSEKESQAPSTPERKQPKNTGSKKESEVDESQGGLFSPLRNEDKSDEKPAAESEKVPAQDESAAKQDANLEASEPTRPSPEDDEPESASSSPSASTFIDYSEAVKSGELPEGEKNDGEESPSKK